MFLFPSSIRLGDWRSLFLQIMAAVQFGLLAAQRNSVSWISETHIGELSWARATAAFALGDLERTNRQIERALRNNPWNENYLTMALRLYKPAIGFETSGLERPRSRN